MTTTGDGKWPTNDEVADEFARMCSDEEWVFHEPEDPGDPFDDWEAVEWADAQTWSPDNDR